MRQFVLAALLFAAEAAAAESQTAGEGGAVINDAALHWSVTVPAGWSWTSAADGAPMVVTSGDGKQPGDVTCSVAGGPPKTGESQEAINTATRRDFDFMLKTMKGETASDVAGATFSEIVDAKGVARMVLIGPFEDSGEGDVSMAGFALFDAVEGGGVVSCSFKLARGKSELGDAPVLKPLRALLRSLEPL